MSARVCIWKARPWLSPRRHVLSHPHDLEGCVYFPPVDIRSNVPADGGGISARADPRGIGVTSCFWHLRCHYPGRLLSYLRPCFLTAFRCGHLRRLDRSCVGLYQRVGTLFRVRLRGVENL